MPTYVGVDGKARKVKNIYVGVDGKARKVKAGYVGVDGKARLFYKSGNKIVKYLKTINNVVDGGEVPSTTVFNGKLYVGNGYKSGMTSAELSTMQIISPDLTISKLSYSSIVADLAIGGLIQLGLCSNDTTMLSVGGFGPSASGKYSARQAVWSSDKNHTLSSHGYTYGYPNCCVSGCRFNNSQKMLFAGGYYRWSSSSSTVNVIAYDEKLARTEAKNLSLSTQYGTGMAAIKDKILVGSTNITGTYVGTSNSVYGVCSYKESDLSQSFSYNLKNSSYTYDAAVSKCGNYLLHVAGNRKTTSSGANTNYRNVYAFDYDLRMTAAVNATYSGKYYRGMSQDFNGKAIIYGCFNGTNLLTVDVYNEDLTKQEVEVKTTTTRTFAAGAQIGDYYLIIGGPNNTLSADVYIEE